MNLRFESHSAMFVPLVNVVRKGRRRDEKLIGLARLSLAGQTEYKNKTKTNGGRRSEER